MGAEMFTTQAAGNTAEEAFRNAIKDALHWHGHGGYTGTIAEKDSFELWDLPALPANNSTEQETDLTDRYAHALEYHSNAQEIFANSKTDSQILAAALGADAIRKLIDTYEDKWGPAIAVKLPDNTYGFFGWAST